MELVGTDRRREGWSHHCAGLGALWDSWVRCHCRGLWPSASSEPLGDPHAVMRPLPEEQVSLNLSPDSHRGELPRPGRLPSGISWRSSHMAHAGFWKSADTHSLLILFSLKKKVIYKIPGALGLPPLCSGVGMW